jgi:hypothetical protein
MSVPSQTEPHADPEPAPAHAARLPWGAPATALQVPTFPATSHAAHCELHPVSQHTPSTQKLEAHSVEAVHVAPFGFAQRPSDPATLQRKSVPQLAELQHTLSVQLPEAHADAPLQAAPRISFAVHVSPLQ